MSIPGGTLRTVRVGRTSLGSYVGAMAHDRDLIAHLDNADLLARSRLSSLGVVGAMIAACVNPKYRHSQQMQIIVMQALWFASPVFFFREIFDSPNLALWSAINPVLALCEVLRDPVLFDRAPELREGIVIGVWTALSWLVALLVTANNDRKSIHYV